MKFINIRGCNGSGKTTLLRKLVAEDREATVRSTPEGVLVGEAAHKPIPFTFTTSGLAVLGDYLPAKDNQTPLPTTAGCDRVKTQAATKKALEWAAAEPGVKLVLFEGVVVSTIYGPWREWSRSQGGMAWAFLNTPLDVCLKRIQVRNGGKPIQTEQVADKHRTIARVAGKAREDGEVVYELGFEAPLTNLLAVIADLTPPEDF